MLILASVISCLLVAAGQVQADEDQDELYKKIFEDVDVDSILSNDRILDSYLKCFFNTGPCSEIADAMKGEYFAWVVYSF